MASSAAPVHGHGGCAANRSLPWLPAVRLSLRRLFDRRGVVALEFAIVVLPFLTIIFFIFSLGMHFFYQELLDTGLHNAARQLQTGTTQTSIDGNAFISKYLCPAMGNLVSCTDLAIKVQKVSFAAGGDYFNITTGQLPTSGGALTLAGFGTADFCNAGPSQFVLVTAIYIGPSIIGGLLPGVLSISFGGTQVDAIMSQIATYTENYAASTAAGTRAPSC